MRMLSNSDKAVIRKTMKRNLERCRDNQTGEINHTLLAEEACCDLNMYQGDNIPEEFFEIALDFS